MKTIVAALLVATCASASAQVYKCIGPDGKVSYQATACATNDTAAKLKYVPNSSSESSAASSSASPSTPVDKPAGATITDNQKLKKLLTERRLREIKDEIDALRLQVDKDIASLENSKLYSKNNQAGAVRDQGLTASMQVVRDVGNDKVKVLQDEAASLRAEMASLK